MGKAVEHTSDGFGHVQLNATFVTFLEVYPAAGSQRAFLAVGEKLDFFG
jgi:hypothetical protein